MLHRFWIFAGAAVIVAASASGVVAKSAVQCKPALTGWGIDDFQVKAKRKARDDFLAKAAAYGKVLSQVVIDRGCAHLRGQQGWKCWHKAQPCVDGGLKPSISRTPFVEPPRLRRAPKLMRPGARLLRPEPGTTGLPRRASVLSGGFRIR